MRLRFEYLARGVLCTQACRHDGVVDELRMPSPRRAGAPQSWRFFPLRCFPGRGQEPFQPAGRHDGQREEQDGGEELELCESLSSFLLLPQVCGRHAPSLTPRRAVPFQESPSPDSNTHSFSSSSITTYSKVGNEPPRVFQASSSTRCAPGGVRMPGAGPAAAWRLCFCPPHSRLHPRSRLRLLDR